MSIAITNEKLKHIIKKAVTDNITSYTDIYFSQATDSLDDDAFAAVITAAQKALNDKLLMQLTARDTVDAITYTRIKECLADPQKCGYPKPANAETVGFSAGAIYAVLFCAHTGRAADADECLDMDNHQTAACDKAVKNKLQNQQSPEQANDPSFFAFAVGIIIFIIIISFLALIAQNT